MRGRVPGVSGVALTLASAVTYGATFPPLEWHALAWLALVPFLVAVARARSLAGAAGLGLTWGTTAGFCVSFWLPGMVSSFFEIEAWRAFGYALAVELSAGCYYAAFAVFTAAAARAGVAAPPLVAAGWFAGEWLRAHWPIANPWALSGYSQVIVSPLAQLAELGGPFSIGALLALVNASIANAIEPLLAARSPRTLWLALSAVALASAFVFGTYRLGADRADGRTLRVAVVQGAIDPERRFAPEFVRQNLSHYLRLTREILPEAPDLIVWPEYAVELPLRLDPLAQIAVAELSRGTPATLIFGGPDVRRVDGALRKFNSAFIVRGGRVVAQYDKVDLMPFSESNPLARPATHSAADTPFSAGANPGPVEVEGLRIAVLLCSEAMHPARTRDVVRRGAELIVNPSNDDWFGHPSAQRQQLLAIALRAIEARRWVVRAAASGPSAIIDPLGRIEWISASSVPSSTVREIRLDSYPR